MGIIRSSRARSNQHVRRQRLSQLLPRGVRCCAAGGARRDHGGQRARLGGGAGRDRLEQPDGPRPAGKAGDPGGLRGPPGAAVPGQPPAAALHALCSEERLDGRAQRRRNPGRRLVRPSDRGPRRWRDLHGPDLVRDEHHRERAAALHAPDRLDRLGGRRPAPGRPVGECGDGRARVSTRLCDHEPELGRLRQQRQSRGRPGLEREHHAAQLRRDMRTDHAGSGQDPDAEQQRRRLRRLLHDAGPAGLPAPAGRPRGEHGDQ